MQGFRVTFLESGTELVINLKTRPEVNALRGREGQVILNGGWLRDRSEDVNVEGLKKKKKESFVPRA